MASAAGMRARRMAMHAASTCSVSPRAMQAAPAAEHADGATCLPAQVTMAALASLAVSGSRSQHTCPGGVTVQMLGGEGVQLSRDAQQLKDWVEKGAGPPT